MDCLFATKPNKLNIPFLKNINNKLLRELYFSHYLLSDGSKIIKDINPTCVVDKNSFTKPLLWVNYDNSCLIEETEPFKYHIVNKFIDVRMESEKSPLLIDKKGFIDLGIKTTYYYSLTRLRTKGIVKMNDEWIPVEGLSWMDRQWAQGPSMEDDIWTWFSIQLDNNTDLLCFVYGKNIKTYHACIVDAQGNARFTNKVIICDKEIKYQSKETGNTYQLGHNIVLPEFNLDLNIKPFKKEQEMVFGIIAYWEGGISVEGTINNKKVSGKGFCELVVPKIDPSKYLKSKAKSLRKTFRDVSDIATKSINYINSRIQN